MASEHIGEDGLFFWHLLRQHVGGFQQFSVDENIEWLNANSDVGNSVNHRRHRCSMSLLIGIAVTAGHVLFNTVAGVSALDNMTVCLDGQTSVGAYQFGNNGTVRYDVTVLAPFPWLAIGRYNSSLTKNTWGPHILYLGDNSASLSVFAYQYNGLFVGVRKYTRTQFAVWDATQHVCNGNPPTLAGVWDVDVSSVYGGQLQICIDPGTLAVTGTKLFVPRFASCKR